ncbi:Suppressor of CDC25 protein 1 [Cladobotryum mycophilum]|uniref:Suppressor of CDC25 protein 1 n=1 Tax=Cladobotryum mycophilum TaxID=491253 RepID=A0ABR0SF64_9HYPO
MADENSEIQPTQGIPHVSITNNGVTSTTPVPLPHQGLDTPQKDIIMSDVPMDQAGSPAPATFAPSPAPPGRTGTPAQGSRAASAHPDPGFSVPSEAPPHGDSTRRYLNTKVTGVLLEGMKLLAKDQPDEPLRVLGEYLLQKSRELEGTS